jgi:hypothetical protein
MEAAAALQDLACPVGITEGSERAVFGKDSAVNRYL